MGFNVAIDGPAGAGKSTVARNAAEKLSFIYVDTGAMYRAIGLFMKKNQMDLKDEKAIGEKVKEAEVTIGFQNGVQQVYLNGENVSSDIRTEEIGACASAVSVYPAVREHLLLLQRKLAEQNNVLMDGRDIGTCILPNADIKIYLTADAKVRAERRCAELREKGEECSVEEITKKILDRDYQDMNRKTAPLKRAEDAVLLDTSFLTIEESISAVVSLVEKKRDCCSRTEK